MAEEYLPREDEREHSCESDDVVKPFHAEATDAIRSPAFRGRLVVSEDP